MSAILAALVGVLVASPTATAAQSIKKAMWGPTQVNGVSQFPIYKDLGVGIYQTAVWWHQVAPTRPRHSMDPADPAYRWPADVDYAIREAAKYKIRVSIMLIGAPGWANGGRSWQWVPYDPADFGRFAGAAARRWPSVRRWMMWGEPSKAANFRPLGRETRGKPLTDRQKDGPRFYSRMLDAAYARVKAVSRSNIVIGGNTFTVGDISPVNYVKAMRLPNGQPPRMDLYGHNPFTSRTPDLRRPPLRDGLVDFSSLDDFAPILDRYLRRRDGKNRNLRFFLSEFTAPTDHRNHEFNFWVTRKTQADWAARCLRISRDWSRIYTFGWHTLHDEAPRPAGDEVNRGLLEWDGDRKPSYYAYRRG